MTGRWWEEGDCQKEGQGPLHHSRARRDPSRGGQGPSLGTFPGFILPSKKLVGGREIVRKRDPSKAGGAGALRGTFPGFTLPKIEESWANEGDRRLVEGRREEERDCQTRGRAQWGDPGGRLWEFSRVVGTCSPSKNRGILGYGG